MAAVEDLQFTVSILKAQWSLALLSQLYPGAQCYSSSEVHLYLESGQLERVCLLALL